MQFLDLDSVNKPLGEFQLGNTTYQIWPLKLRNVINLSVIESQVDGAETHQQIRVALDLLDEVIPECPRATLEELTMDQMNALMQWLQGLGTDTLEKNSQPPETTTASAA